MTVAEEWRNKKYVAGREIAPNTGANVTKFFTLATKLQLQRKR